jgi:hypothetical protein
MKKLGANFDGRILINVGIMATRVSKWLAKFDGILSWGQYEVKFCIY